MSKDNQTVSILQNNLDQDLDRRRKELLLLKKNIPKQQGDKQNLFIRVGITLLYAHWEGFIKYAAECYLQHVSLKKLKYHELDYCFIALCSRKFINELIKTNKFAIQKEMVQNLLGNLEEEKRAYIPYEAIINTKSNLNFEVFEDICTLINIENTNDDLKKNMIDERLVTLRNKIAHGQYLTLDYQLYLELYDTIIDLMENFKDDLINAALTEQYKRKG